MWQVKVPEERSGEDMAEGAAEIPEVWRHQHQGMITKDSGGVEQS